MPQLLKQLFGIEISVASINRLRQEMSQALESVVTQAHEYVQSQAQIHSDETSFSQGNCDGQNPKQQQGWLWVVVTRLFRWWVCLTSMVGDDALKSIDIAIESDKSDLILLNEKAVILNNKKEYRASIATYDNLISKQPEAYAYSNRGAIKSNLGQKQAEIIDYDRAIAINPNYAESFYNRGIAKYDLGQKQAAIADLKNGAELFRQQNRMNDYQNISGLIQKIGS